MIVVTLLLACSGSDPEPSAPHDTPSTETGTVSSSTPPEESAEVTGHTGTPPIVGEAPLQFYGSVPRNVLMISIDTFRRDHIGAYGDLDLTPTIDGLIAEGVSFDDHMQCSNWTYPTTTCTLLGRSHVDNGFMPRLSGDRQPFPEGTPFLATWLSAGGIDTSISSRNGWLSEEWNSVQGYQTILSNGGGLQTQLGLVAAHVQGVLAESPDTRWFAHAHAIEPHVPYAPPEEYLAEVNALPPIIWDLSDSGDHYGARDTWPNMSEEAQELVLQHMMLRYQAEIRYVDDQIAAGLADLEAQGLLDDTLVVLWNDHGEQFWEHGNLTHAYHLHHEENDGFLVMWADNIVPARYDGPTHATDLAPTLLQLLEQPIPDEVTGVPLGSRSADSPRFAHSVARRGGVSSVVHDGQKLIFDWDSGLPQRYDLLADPLETVDLWGTDPAADQALWALLQPQVQEASALAPDQFVLWPVGMEPSATGDTGATTTTPSP
jgi:arylsulfatase A-like enzyme